MAERVLVTGARSAAALDIARSLRAAGLEPHLADCSPARLAGWSRTAGPVHRYGSPVLSPADFAADIRIVLDRLRPARVIPTCEEVFHLAALAETDGWTTLLYAPPMERLATLHAKDRFAGLCKNLGLRVPETTVATDAESLRKAARRMGDVVLKPVWSRFGARTLISPDATAVAAVAPSEDQPWVVQHRIRGDDVSFWAACDDGRVNAFSAYGSDRRSRGGAALAFRPLASPVSDRLRSVAATLAAWAGKGQISCDAVIDAEGRAWLIECNPRATSGVHLFDRSEALGRALMGLDRAEPVDEPRCLGPTVWGRRGARRAGRDVLSAPGDPWPVVGALADAAGFTLASWRTGRTLTEAMTADIEWNGRALEPDRWSRT